MRRARRAARDAGRLAARLETATRRPSTTTTWRIAKALRPRGTLHDRVTVDERLLAAAGASLRDYSLRPHAARERVRRELVAEAGGEMPVTEADNFTSFIVTDLAVVEDHGLWVNADKWPLGAVLA